MISPVLSKLQNQADAKKYSIDDFNKLADWKAGITYTGQKKPTKYTKDVLINNGRKHCPKCVFPKSGGQKMHSCAIDRGGRRNPMLLLNLRVTVINTLKGEHYG